MGRSKKNQQKIDKIIDKTIDKKIENVNIPLPIPNLAEVSAPSIDLVQPIVKPSAENPKDLILKAAEILTVKNAPKSWLVVQLEALAEKVEV